MKDDKSKNTSPNREKKEKVVAELSEKAKKANALFFANYKGMTNKQIEDLKKGLKKADSEFVVAKNTLLKLALKKSSKTVGSADEKLSGQLGTIFAYSDTILPLKEIIKTIKALKAAGGQFVPSLSFGIFEGNLLEEKELERLSALPSRDVLIGQLVGQLKSPIYSLHRALNWNLQKLVMTLSAIQKIKT